MSAHRSDGGTDPLGAPRFQPTCKDVIPDAQNREIMMDHRDPETPAFEPANITLDLDLVEARRKKTMRRNRLNKVQIPVLRLVGFCGLAVIVFLHNLLILQEFNSREVINFAITVIAYSLLSWLVLWLYFDRIRKVDLGLTFLILDLAFFIYAIYISGAARSWLFFLLVVRVADQTSTSFRRVLFFGCLSVLSYGLMLSYLQIRTQVEVFWPAELAKISIILAANVYISLSARTAEKLRLRTQAAIQLARQLISELKHKADQLKKSNLEIEQANQRLQEEIEERKRAESEVRQQKQYIEAVLQNSPVAIVTLDLAERIASCNPAFERMFGYAREEALGRNLDDLITIAGIQEQATEFTRRVMEGETIYQIVKRSRNDGTLIDLELFGVPVIVAGEHVGALGIYHDITERVRADQALRQAKETAEAAAQAKSEFLANMSHEIRTPLNAVIGMTGLLFDTKLTSEQLEFVETIRNSGDSLLNIINDILDFSKIEAGKLELEKQPLYLPDLIEDSLDLLAPRAAEKGLDLAYLIEDQVPPTIVGDVTRLRQVLVNLLGNAVKFTDSGEVVVSVSTRPKQGAGQLLQFSVRDTGIGISPDQIQKLFQSFSQVDASTTRKYGGTGLGLAISQRLAQMMGGEIWVESQPGIGSTFSFTILAESAPTEPRMYLRAHQPGLKDKRLLIVDDNATNRRILVRQSESWGMVPRAAASGQEALEWIRRGETFDIGILDMQMPEMDGLTLATEIARHHRKQQLPLVMLTSVGQVDGPEAKGRFTAQLTKPVKASQLYDTIIGIFDGSPTRTSTRKPGPQIDHKMALKHPLRILLAEDNTVNQKVALRLLERLGYRADVAANGLEVLEALERQRYDLVFMDIQMPEMDGVEATRQITKAIPAPRRPRIVAMTAHAMKGDRERYLKAGMDDYISKPVRFPELIDALGSSKPLTIPYPADRVSSSPPELHGEPIDRAVLEELRQIMGEDAPELLTDLIETFLSDAPNRLDAMQKALHDREATKLFRAAHTLKTSSATFGATALSECCEQIEMIAAESRWGALDRLIEFAQKEYEKVQRILENEYLKRLGFGVSRRSDRPRAPDSARPPRES